MPHRWSRRLDWNAPQNALSRLETNSRTQTGGLRFDLTSTNPTTPEIELLDDGQALADILARAEFAHYQPMAGGSSAARHSIAATACADNVGADQIRGLAERVVMTTSSSESYAYLFKLLCDPGDVVLVPEPSYPLFDFLARLEGLETAPYFLEPAGNARWEIDFDLLDETFRRCGRRVRALVVVTPNNPTGSVLRKEALDALDARCAAADVAIIADEVFGDFIAMPSDEHVRHIAAHHRTQSLTFSLGGLSKSCGLPQLKLGWITIGGPASEVARARAGLELILDTYLPVAAPVETALGRLLELGRTRRRTIDARLARNRQALASHLRRPTSITALAAEGGWLQILRLPATQSDEAWSLDFLASDGLLVQPGYFFDFPQDSHVIISLLASPATFDAGVEALVKRVAARVPTTD